MGLRGRPAIAFRRALVRFASRPLDRGWNNYLNRFSNGLGLNVAYLEGRCSVGGPRDTSGGSRRLWPVNDALNEKRTA